MAKKRKPVSLSDTDPTPVDVDDLWLDPENPRLAESDFKLTDQAGILGALWRERAVKEIVDSIIACGEYWKHEILLAARERGRLVVVEGNRRLAAVKVLVRPALRKAAGIKAVPHASAELKAGLAELPVIECKRALVWEYIGFKHVNGPQDWDSIAKAQYVARVHNEFGIPLERIAETIGDQHETVVRMYRGLMVLEQAEREGVFDRRDRWKTRFAYSHLWTGLGYVGIQKFLGVTSRKLQGANPVPKSKLKNLGELLLWLYGSKDREEEPKIKSQNPGLRNLDEVLRSPKGVAMLRVGLPLRVALDASRGDERLLREAMAQAEHSLRTSKGLVATGYHGEGELMETCTDIRDLATSLYGEMDQMHVKGKSGRKR